MISCICKPFWLDFWGKYGIYYFEIVLFVNIFKTEVFKAQIGNWYTYFVNFIVAILQDCLLLCGRTVF